MYSRWKGVGGILLGAVIWYFFMFDFVFIVCFRAKEANLKYSTHNLCVYVTNSRNRQHFLVFDLCPDRGLKKTIAILNMFFTAPLCLSFKLRPKVQVTPSSCTSAPVPHSKVCSFRCPRGYRLEGPSSKRCTADGQWTKKNLPTTCKGQREDFC